jgi:transcriptional regulator of acetoin/glycerol metabolism
LKRSNKSNFDHIQNIYTPLTFSRSIQSNINTQKKKDFLSERTGEELNATRSELNGYLLESEEKKAIDEDEFIYKTNKKILIIAAEPGMGKSLILDHFTKNSSAENYFLKIVLNTCKETLSDTNFKDRLQNSEDLFEYVLKSFLNKSNEQEISLLKHLAKEGKITLMFDG